MFLLGRLALRLDRKISWTSGIHSRFRRSPPFFRTNFLYDDEPDSAGSYFLADLCYYHSFPLRTFSLVRVKSSLASPQAPDSNRLAASSCISGLQPALGGVHAHQLGMDP